MYPTYILEYRFESWFDRLHKLHLEFPLEYRSWGRFDTYPKLPIDTLNYRFEF